MTSAKYVETITGALDRLQGTGFYLSGSFANHAPMVAEALATLGYCDEVDSWIDANLDRRQHGPLPRSRHKISVRAWREALGHHARGGDWVELFRDELAATAWRTVLAKWWPRLLPGIGGSLTHGLIRTAHAVRGLAAADEPSDLQIDELARGLAFWATVYSPLSGAIEAVPDADPTLVGQSLSQLTAAYAGHYAATKPSFPIPLIHTITAPAALRLVLAELPADLHAISLSAVIGVNRQLFGAFGGRAATTPPPNAVEPGIGDDFASLAALAVDIGDEHAIKLCEAAMREHAVHPDPRYLTAARTAMALISTSSISRRSAP